MHTLRKKGMRRLRIAGIQLSARHAVKAQCRPYSSKLSIYPPVTAAALFFHKNTAARRGGYIKLPYFNRVLRPNIPASLSAAGPQAGKNNQTSLLKCYGTYLVWTVQLSLSNRNRGNGCHVTKRSCRSADQSIKKNAIYSTDTVGYRKKIFRSWFSNEKILHYKVK